MKQGKKVPVRTCMLIPLFICAGKNVCILKITLSFNETIQCIDPLMPRDHQRRMVLWPAAIIVTARLKVFEDNSFR